MKNHFKNIILFVLFSLSGIGGFGISGYAQLYPVQLTPIFNSPYSVKISDYATSMDTKMQLLINPNDISINNRQVRLKLFIQGNGINIQSSDYVQGLPPLYINGGELKTITNTDISALFRLENLQGISANQYANPLPEGMYSFCFEMYDYVTNQKISRKSCANLYLILNDPPLLNTPQNKELIAYTEFPNILFTWTPRQINATNVSYQFELKQLFDDTLDPQIGFQMAPILHQETLFGTALLYNLSKPVLVPGMRYAWRVKAISTTGLSENAVFKNEGYSEIYSFKYTAACLAPSFVLSESQSTKSVKITWQGVPEQTRYQIQYRKQGVRNAQWFSNYSQNTQSLLTELEPGVTYEFRVGSSCESGNDGVQSFTYSGINTFTTTIDNKEVAYNCGIVPEISINNQKPLTNLIQSETFTAGDFPVTILELKGENSPYSGRGYIIVPYLADTKIAVEFNSIVINTDYQLISGVVETSYNPEWKNVTDVEDFTGEGQGGQIEETVPFTVADIVINANGDIVVNGTQGEQIIIPGGKDTVITEDLKDADGNSVPGKVYTVDSKGNGSNEGMAAAPDGKPTPTNTDGVDANGQATAFTAQGASIAFSVNSSSTYAFDVMPKNATTALQKLYKKVDGVALPYKAVVNGFSDTLIATLTLTDTIVKPENIVFKTQNGALINATRNDKTFELTVKGNLSYAEEQILATVKQGDKWKVIGAFMLVHISPKDVNVALVPTDKVSEDKLDAIIVETQKTYNKVGIKINFKKEGILNINSVVSGNTITTEKNTITSTYSTEQQKINALYKSESYVLFITDKTSSTGQQGYMRLNGQYGYVFNSANSSTPAHELGHGIFKLEHPFEQYNTTEKSTDLLMDYSQGTVLNHQDWKQINDPAFKFYGFQSQSSGELAGGYGLTPDFQFVSAGNSNLVSTKTGLVANGHLSGFLDSNNVKYIWNLKSNAYTVNGIDNGNIYKGVVVNTIGAEATVWLIYNYSDDCTQVKYIRTKYGEISKFISLNDKVKAQVELNSYINLIDKVTKKENSEIYSSSLGCGNYSGSADGNGADISYTNYLDGLGKLANKRFQDDSVNVNANESHVYDYSAIITDKEKNKILSEMSGIKTDSGIITKIFFTDTKTPNVKRKEITDYLANLKGVETALWIDFDANGKATIKTVLGDKIGGSSNTDVNNFLTLLGEVIPQFDGKYNYFNPLTAILDGIASIVVKAKIPERFYNPEIITQDYNPVLYYVSLSDPYSWNLLITDKIIEQQNIKITNSGLVTQSHIYFAIKCGVWNGLVDQVAGLAQTAAIVTNLIDGGDRFAEMWAGIKKLDIWCTESTKENVCIWTLVNKAHSGQTCQIAETVGVDISNVLTFAISFAKVGKAAEISKVLESLDAIQQVVKYTGKLIKVTIEGTGNTAKFVFKVTKAFIKPGFKLANSGKMYSTIIPIAIDLSENLEKAIEKAKELLQNNPSEFENKLKIITSEDANGNLIGEIDIDGQKVEVIVNESEEQLKKSAGKIDDLPSLVRQLVAKPSYKPLRIIFSKPNKTITVVGKWKGELESLYNELSKTTDLNVYMKSGRFDNPGGFNMLSIEDWSGVVKKAKGKGILENTKAFDEFIWDEYNKPWLENAMVRGDDIIIWSDPIDVRNLEKEFLIEGISGKSFYGREIDFIESNASRYNYNFNNGILTGTFSK